MLEPVLLGFEAPDFGDDCFLEGEGGDFAGVAVEDFAVLVEEEGVGHGSVPLGVEGFGKVFGVAFEEVVVSGSAIFGEELFGARGGADVVVLQELGDFLGVFGWVEADGDEF